MIAAIDDLHGAPSAPGTGAVVAFMDVPPAVVPRLRALLAVSHAAARVRRIALRAISRGKSPRFIVPLLRQHERLVQTQAALAEAVASELAAAT